MGRRKKKPLPPRRKRMSREARLSSARVWLPTYGGKNIIRGYARWYGVDLLCAVKELRILGIEISDEREAQLRASMSGRRPGKPRQQEESETSWPHECDEFHAFIAGYTSAGFSYGITWQEWEQLEGEGALEHDRAPDEARGSDGFAGADAPPGQPAESLDNRT